MIKLLKVLLGCFFTSIGIVFFQHAHIVTGGTAGLALNLSYSLKMSFPYVFFIVNLPFYILSIMKMGWNFTLTTLFAVVSVSFLTKIIQMIPEFIFPVWGDVLIGGGFVGVGLSLLFLNKSSLGGTGILTMYLQQRFGWDPGKINLFLDAAIVGSGIFTVGLWKSFFSILSVVVISCIISFFKGRIASTYSAITPTVSPSSCE